MQVNNANNANNANDANDDNADNDELDDVEIDLFMLNAHDDEGWQPGEQARVEQSKRSTILSNKGIASRGLFPLAKQVGRPTIFMNLPNDPEKMK